MNKLLPILLSGAILFTCIPAANSQLQQVVSTKGSSTQEQCATAIKHNQLLQTDPGYAARIAANESAIQAIIAKQQQGAKTTGVYTIPVVVHVIHKGEAVGTATNISTAQIQSAIDNLNDAYRNNSPYNGVDIEIEFCLAQRDPNCASTTGIVRVNGSGTSDYSTNGITTSGSDNETQIKALSKWPNTSYYNIWVVSEIDGNNGGSGTQGYAYFPGAGSDVDGAVMLHNAFGYDPDGSLLYNLKSYTNMNVTATHELGHAFNLYHTFEGDGSGSTCPSGNQCGSGVGDCCSDTPPHKRSSSDCNTSGTNSCDGGSSNSLFVHNFMDYSSDACQTKFTTNQRDRMRAALEGTRNSLINSLACTAPSGSLPAAACEPAVVNADNYPLGVYQFIFNTLDVSSGNTYSEGATGYVDRTCYFQNTVTAGQTYPVTVKTGTSYNHDVRIYIDYNNDGDFVDANETVFSSDNVMTTHSGNITILSSPPVTGQLLRMRVFADYYSSTITSCLNPDYGQAEDYGITISGSCTAPVADFTASATTICAGSSINFTDQTTNSPTSWSWIINGGTPSSSTSQNPSSVAFNTAGTYSVTLAVSNACGVDTMIKSSYITVNTAATASAGSDATICSGSTHSLSGSRGGSATSSTWTTSGTGTFSSTTSLTPTYTPSAADISAGSRTLTITTNDPSGPCPSVNDAMVLTINEAATANAGSDATINSGNSHTLSGSIGGSAASATWTTSGTGTFDNSSSLTATYTPSPADITAGSVTITLTTNDPAGVCNAASDQMVLTINGGGGGNTTKVRTADCGITLSALNQAIYCDAVTGATYYQWEWVNVGLGFTKTVQKTTTAFTPTSATGIKYGTTYDVRVKAKVNGVWGDYGTVCQVTTPDFPSTKVRTADCGITLNVLNQLISCDAVIGASYYQWEWVNVGLGFTKTVTKTGTGIYPNKVSGIRYGVTYTVRVRAQVSGVWGNYGTACTITTPAFPTTKVSDPDCNSTLSSPNQLTWADAVVGASYYNWKWVNTDIGFSKTVTKSSRGIYPSNVSGLVTGKTYDVQVKVWVNGVWGNYGTVCTIAVPAARMGLFGKGETEESEILLTSDSEIREVLVFPNPSSGIVNVNFSGMNENENIRIEMFDVVGQLVFSQRINSGNGTVLINEENNLAKGVYLLRVSAGEMVENRKIVIE